LSNIPLPTQSEEFAPAEKLIRALGKGIITIRYKSDSHGEGKVQFTPYESIDGFHTATLPEKKPCAHDRFWYPSYN
jgi:hypothetical protein